MRIEDTLQRISELDAGIHNPARLMIVMLLTKHKSLDYIRLMNDTRLTSGNITTHLNKLLDCGYITVTKSFIGRRPNTSIELTSSGFCAYLKWGENILCALPEELKPQQPAIAPWLYPTWKKYPLILKDWSYAAPESQLFSSLPEHCLRSHDMPPLDEQTTW